VEGVVGEAGEPVMALSLQEQQTPIFQRMAIALLRATPEHWNTAILELRPPSTQDPSTGIEVAYGHSIYSPEFSRELISPTDELYAATYELYSLSKRVGDHFKRLLFRVERMGTDWRLKAQFDR
jgi:hypothetical protein